MIVTKPSHGAVRAVALGMLAIGAALVGLGLSAETVAHVLGLSMRATERLMNDVTGPGSVAIGCALALLAAPLGVARLLLIPAGFILAGVLGHAHRQVVDDHVVYLAPVASDDAFPPELVNAEPHFVVYGARELLKAREEALRAIVVPIRKIMGDRGAAFVDQAREATENSTFASTVAERSFTNVRPPAAGAEVDVDDFKQPQSTGEFKSVSIWRPQMDKTSGRGAPISLFVCALIFGLIFFPPWEKRS